MPPGLPAQPGVPQAEPSPIQIAAMRARGQPQPKASGATQDMAYQPIQQSSSGMQHIAPPFRQRPSTPDDQDGARAAYMWRRWKSQDAIHAVRDRAIEEMVRMLAGQQWYVWYAPMGRFVDVARFFSEDERRWRQRPVFNRLLPWFMMTHARMVENPPICTFIPGPDQFDQELAETMDNLAKPLWRTMGMVDANDRMWMWAIVSGMGYIKLRVDPNGGDLEPWVGIAPVPVIGPDQQPMMNPQTGQPLMAVHENVPMNQQGQPLAVVTYQGQLIPTGSPYVEREGMIVPEVLSPFAVRGQWGDQPWHHKQWHQDLAYLSPEEVKTTWGVDVQPEALGTSGDGGQLERMLFGQGNFGANLQRFGSEMSAPQTGADQFVRVLCTYERPNDTTPGMEETADSPGGRYTVVTGNNLVLYDGPRPIRWPYTSPIHRWDFVRLPGSNNGRTPLEPQIQPQRAYNRGWSQILEHRNLVTNPIAIVDRGSGLGKVKITNQPGKRYIVNARPGVKPMEWLAPPPLGQDVYETQQLLLRELIDIGNLKGTEGQPAEPDVSGEQVKELRFNSDRAFGSTMRRAVEEYGRLTETLMVMMPIVWSREKIITVAGDDNVSRTITVYPELFSLGHIKVVPDVESMLPDGLAERQQDVREDYREGVFGPLGSPQAIRAYQERKGYPARGVYRPGGTNRSTAEQMLGKLIQGIPAEALPWLPWYDVGTHLDVLEHYACSPDFLKLDPAKQQAIGQRWQLVKFQQMQQEQQALAAQVQQQQLLGGGHPPHQGPHGKPMSPAQSAQKTAQHHAGPDTATSHAPKGQPRTPTTP